MTINSVNIYWIVNLKCELNFIHPLHQPNFEVTKLFMYFHFIAIVSVCEKNENNLGLYPKMKFFGCIDLKNS